MKALLGVQSHFSFHWGVASPARWFERAAELGYEYVGFADLAGLHALPEIVRAARDSTVRPVYGACFPLLDGGRIFAFIRNPIGYSNLCQRLTEWLDKNNRPEPAAGGVPALSPEIAILKFAEPVRTDGLVFITDHLRLWRQLRRIGAEVYWRIGPTLAAPPAEVGRDGCVFVPGPLLLSADDFDTHRLLRAIGGVTTLDRLPDAEHFKEAEPPILMAPPTALLASPERYAGHFAVYAEAIALADRLAGQLADFIPSQDTLFPPVPDDDIRPEWGESCLARLRRLAYEGAVIRYGAVTTDVRNRLESELSLIGRKGFAEYFLVVHDIVSRLAGGDGRVKRGRSITCGRGSGAASLVNYCLGVTNVDVLKHELLFERFLNDGRSDPPDIDVDFAWDERDDLLHRVFAEYGNDRVGRVANHNRYDLRGAFRAAARALGFSDAQITRHLRASPSVYSADPNPGTAAPSAGEILPAVDRTRRKLSVLLRPGRSDWNTVAALSQRLADIPHAVSMHCGGVVISPGVLARTVPTALSGKGMPTIQWEKDGAEEMGLVKIDLLGNRSLAVIRDAIRNISRERGIPEDEVIHGDPTDDPATRKLVETGNTFGVFYLESPSMRLLMAKARRGDFKHAVINSSIIRPAANAFINEYLARMHGKAWEPIHDRLEGLFDESYGIPVYQEDVVRMAMALTDCSYAEADSLRKCLGKSHAAERLMAIFPKFKAMAKENNVDEATLQSFWRTLMSMTGYSFCKPHSASYAQVSFEAAYIRAHYPAHFIAAVLSNGGGYYSVQSYVSEAMRLGLQVRGPDVNLSDAGWRAEGDRAVRTGLMAVSGLSKAGMEAIVRERTRGGEYADLDDFLRRVRLAADDARRLALVGGLDSLAPAWNRPQILWRVAQACGVEGHDQRPAARVNGSLFDRVVQTHKENAPPDLPGYTRQQRYEAEYSVLGFIPGVHPLAMYKEDILATGEVYMRRRKPVLIRAGDLAKHDRELVTILAWPVTAKLVETKHHEAMMFQTFEDNRSLCEAVVFPKEFQRYHRLLGTVQPLWVTGRVEQEFGVHTLHVLSVEPAVRRSTRLAVRPEKRAIASVS